MAAATGSNPIPPEDARRLISAHDGNVALLYIWQSVNSCFDAEAAARDLCMTAGEISAAKEKLDRLFASASSAVSPDTGKTAPVPVKPPQYSTKDIETILSSGNEFRSVVDEATKILGHPLSPTDLSSLLGIYDHLGVPAEVMMELINYCSETSHERYGASRRLPVSAIYREACKWAEEGILSFEDAERYIDEQKRLRSKTAELAAVLKLDANRISATPLKYIESWALMGFEEPAIAEAFDRTITNTGKLSWGYMDAILKKWHNAGLHTIKEINEKDRKNPSNPQPSSKGRGVNTKAIIDLFNDTKK